jgi:hypothetical protein
MLAVGEMTLREPGAVGVKVSDVKRHRIAHYEARSSQRLRRVATAGEEPIQ